MNTRDHFQSSSGSTGSTSSRHQQHQHQQPQSLTSCNEELLEVLQDLRARRAEVHRQVLAAEEEKARIQQEIAALSERLKGLDTALGVRLQARVEYDRTIRETEIAYAKIVESSETLLRVLRREATHLAQGQGQEKRQQQQQQVAKGWE